MIIADSSLKAWIQHRIGDTVPPESLPQYVQKALDQNRAFAEYADTVGQRVVHCYVGFVDLASFSTAVSGLAPREVYDFLAPFLNATVDILTANSCLVDKTIGDEIMFVMPFGEEKAFPPTIPRFANVMAALSSYGVIAVDRYQFRVGVSMGDIYFDYIGNDQYREVAAFGEAISVARRLISVPEIESPLLPLCAIGRKKGARENDSESDKLTSIVSLCTNYHDAWKLKQEMTNAALKGVDTVEYAILECNPDVRRV